MKNLILDKNFINEVDKIEKDHKNAVVYPWKMLNWDSFLLYNMEDGKIAPIVRFLISWRKKINFFLIFWSIFLFIIFLWIIIFLFLPKNEVKKNIAQTETVKTVLPVEDKKNIIDQDSINKNYIDQDKFNFEVINEIDTMRGLKQQAELEVLETKFELSRLKIEYNDKIKQNEKLISDIDILKKSLIEKNNIINDFNVKKNNSPADNFIYYLWNNFYSKCEKTKDEKIIENCKTLYFNFLEYGKDW